MLYKNLTFFSIFLITLNCHPSERLSDKTQKKSSFWSDDQNLSLIRNSACGRRDRVEYFLKKNCDINYATTKTKGKTPLMAAAIFNHLRIVKTLVDHRDQSDNELEIDLQDNDGNTALMHACANLIEHPDDMIDPKYREFVDSLYTDEAGDWYLEGYFNTKDYDTWEKYKEKEKKFEEKEKSLIYQLRSLFLRPVKRSYKDCFPEDPNAYSSRIYDLETYIDKFEHEILKNHPSVWNQQKSSFRTQSAKKIIYLFLNRGANYTLKNRAGKSFRDILKKSCEDSEDCFKEIFEQSKIEGQDRWNIIASMLDQNGFSDDLITFFFPFCIDEKNDELAIKKKGYLE